MESSLELWKGKLGGIMAYIEFEDDSDDFDIIMATLDGLNELGTEWDDLLNLTLLASAYCGQMAEISPDEYMEIISSIRVTDDGVYGEA